MTRLWAVSPWSGHISGPWFPDVSLQNPSYLMSAWGSKSPYKGNRRYVNFSSFVYRDIWSADVCLKISGILPYTMECVFFLAFDGQLFPISYDWSQKEERFLSRSRILQATNMLGSVELLTSSLSRLQPPLLLKTRPSVFGRILVCIEGT